MLQHVSGSRPYLLWRNSSGFLSQMIRSKSVAFILYVLSLPYGKMTTEKQVYSPDKRLLLYQKSHLRRRAQIWRKKNSGCRAYVWVSLEPRSIFLALLMEHYRHCDRHSHLVG